MLHHLKKKDSVHSEINRSLHLNYFNLILPSSLNGVTPNLTFGTHFYFK